MNKSIYIKILFLFMITFCTYVSLSGAKENKMRSGSVTSAKANILDANQISMYILNDGTTCRNPETGRG